MSNLINDKDLVERILDKLDEMSDEITEIKITLVEQHGSLKEHMRRSDALETQLNSVKKDIQPVQKHIAMVETGIKALGLLSLLVGIIASIVKMKEVLF